jgi:hypothetical protein
MDGVSIGVLKVKEICMDKTALSQSLSDGLYHKRQEVTDETKVEETLFFYPLVGLGNNSRRNPYTPSVVSPTKNVSTSQSAIQPQPQSLYADAIIDGKFNRVKEAADESETNFELKLNRTGDTTAKVVVYSGAYRRILANPSFLEGCEKQLIGNNYTSITTTKEGVAQKDSDGKWRITTVPEVKIS